MNAQWLTLKSLHFSATILAFASAGCSRPDLISESAVERNVGTLIQHGSTQCADPISTVSIPFEAAELGNVWDEIPHQVDDGLSGEWGLSVADFDNDGNLDMYIPRFGPGRLLLGDGSGDFSLGSEDRIPPEPWGGSESREWYTMGSVAVDVDGDGSLDIVESNVGMPIVLLNDGFGFFTDVSLDFGFDQADGMDYNTAWADYDLDGDLDVYIALYPLEDPSPEQIEAGGYADGVPGVLLENRGVDGFVDRSELLPAETNDGHPFAAGWHDVNADGRPELILAHDHGWEIRSNRAWQFDGERFQDVSDATGLNTALDAMGLGVGDLNGDGLPDFVFTGWAEFSLVESIGDNQWVSTEVARGLVPSSVKQQAGWGVEMGDLNNDGRLDIVAQFGHWENYPDEMDNADEFNPDEQPDAVYLLNEAGEFEETAVDWGMNDTGIGRGLVLADLNRDGRLDVIKRMIFDDPIVYLSNCSTGSWVNVHLRDESAWNSHGVGAKIVVESEGQQWTRWMQAGGTSIASSGPPETHFGLGRVTEIDSLTVHWPDGQVDVFTDIAVNQQLTVER